MQSLEVPNYLKLPISLLDEQNLEFGIKQRFLKQILTAQVMYLYNLWRVLQETNDQFTIGLIGCGVVGKLIIKSLLVYLNRNKDSRNQLNPWQINISTRRPESLSDFEQRGLQIYFDNDKLIQNSDFIILAIPPTLDNWSLIEMKSSFQQRFASPKKPFVVSLISNISSERISKLLQIPYHIHKTNVHIDLLAQGVKDYLGFVQNILSLHTDKIFSTEVEEDIIKHIMAQSYLHQIDSTKFTTRIMSLIKCCNQCLGIANAETFDEVFKDDRIVRAVLGLSQIEFSQSKESSKFEPDDLIKHLVKVGYERRYFEYQASTNK